MSVRSRILFETFFRQQSSSGFVRLYGRWSHRKPAKVLLPFEADPNIQLKKEEIIVLDKSFENKSQKSVNKNIKEVKNNETEIKSLQNKSNENKNKREEKLKKRNFYLSQKKVFDDEGQIIFEKLKENDGRLSQILIRLKSKKERLRNGQILVEGWRLIVDGLQAKCSLKYVIFSHTEDLNNLRPFLPKTGVTVYKIPYKEIEMWSDVETSPGIFGVFETPTPENIKQFSRPLPLHLICDNIRVPGNLGAILRTSVGAGCEKVLLTKGCVDLWDPKVIRSGAGAHFRLPIYHSMEWEDINKQLQEDTALFIADNNTKVYDEVDDIENDENRSESMVIPVLPYYGVDYASMNNITLILGGETEGISEDSYRLAAQRNGFRLNVPTQRGVDSLNTGMAAAVILFEIRKQVLQKWTRDKMEKQRMGAT